MDNKEMNGNVASPTMDIEKKFYDLDFLNRLKESPLSKIKPENIVHQDIIIGSPQNDFLPGFGKGPRNPLPNRRSQGKPSLRPNTSMGSPRPNMRQISLSLRSDVKLNETENAWKPSRMRSEDLEAEQKETQDILKKFRSVLNKLTPQKFDTLISQVRELNINTMERLKGVIDLVFEKALDEPNYSVTYALMCKELEQIKVRPTEGEKAVNFRSLILGRCQHEFEKESTQDLQVEVKQKEIDECSDPEKKKELQIIFEEEKRKVRMRSVGNVRFIGELFKQKLTLSSTMLECIHKLLLKMEEETLECLCKLLTTIGKDLETIHKKDLSHYFDDMKAIVDRKKGQNISSRVRFMIQDVIDLRGRKWVPRKIVAQSNPKTIDQIQIESEMEQMLTYANNYNPPTPKQDDRNNDRFDRPANKRGASRSVNNDDGWTPAPSRNFKPAKIDTEKLSKLSTYSQIRPDISLSPASMSWEKGASSKNTFSPRNNNNVKKTASTESRNMYNILLQETSDDSAPAPAKKAGKNKSKRDRPMTMRSKSVIEYPVTSNDEGYCYGRDNTEKIHNLMTKCQDEKVYSIMDKVEIYLIKGGIDIEEIMKETILWAVQFSKLSNVQILGEVTGRIVQNKKLTREKYIEIFKKVIDTSFDLFLEGDDNSWVLLAGFIWGHQVKDPLTMNQIHTILTKIVAINKGYDFLLAFFNMKSDAKAKALWEDGNMRLTDWFSKDKEEKFLKSVKLQCFGSQQITDPDEAIQQLISLMSSKTPVSKIEEWIKASIPNPREIWFVRALTEAVYKFILCSSENLKPRFDDEHAKQRLNTYFPLLVTYIGETHNRELEMHCLYAIQRLLLKLEHPMNIAGLIFGHLADSGEVVSNDTFLAWESNSEQHEPEGRGVLVKSLTSFFTDIRSNEDSSD